MRMTRNLWAGLAACSLLLLAGCGDSGKKSETAAAPAAVAPKTIPNPLRVASEGAYPPFNMTDSSGKIIGFEIDLANELCKRINVTCEIVAQNWDGIIPGLQAGKFDAIMAGMSITEEREQVVDFTAGYSTTPAYFLALNSNAVHQVDYGLPRVNLTELDDAEKASLAKLREVLKGKTIGVQAATIHANFIEDLFGNSVDVRRYDTQENLALDLAAGRIDAGLADGSAWEPFLKSEGGKDARFFGPGFDGGIFGRGIGIAIRKNEGPLLDALNGAIASMKADGSLKKLAEQWFGFDASMP
jgi:octopine/nopaline transport system substrate-binding protein